MRCTCWFRLVHAAALLFPHPPAPSLPPFLPYFLGFHSFQSAVRHFCLAYQDRFAASAQLGVCHSVLFTFIFLLYLISLQMRLSFFFLFFFFFSCCCNQPFQRRKRQSIKRRERSVSAPPLWSQPAAAAITLPSSETAERLSPFRASRAALDLWM